MTSAGPCGAGAPCGSGGAFRDRLVAFSGSATLVVAPAGVLLVEAVPVWIFP
jgi:hypothetical protein